MPPWWLWIPITIAAAAAQTLRNATQRHLSTDLGTLGATLVRFLYGLPFAALWLLAVSLAGNYELPTIDGAFVGWLVLGALSQIAGTALLLRTMREQNFTIGVAYSKSEVMQVAVFGFAIMIFYSLSLSSGSEPSIVFTFIAFPFLGSFFKEIFTQ